MGDNLPNIIRIGAIDYEVGRKNDLILNDSLLGEITYGNARINIDEQLCGSKMREVLVHEMTHGILIEAGYDEHTEEQANRIGKVLAMVLRDNDFTFMRDKEAE